MAWEPKKPLSIETVEVAPPKAGEVRIKVSIDTQFPKTLDSILENFLCRQPASKKMAYFIALLG